MRSISPVASLLLAVGLVAYFLGVSAPQTPAQMGYTAQKLPNSHVSHPRDWVRIQEGTVYVVPAGKILVLTACGALFNSSSNVVLLYIDGVFVLAASSLNSDGNGTSIKEIPIGLTAPAGSIVTVADTATGANDAWAWGYLVNA